MAQRKQDIFDAAGVPLVHITNEARILAVNPAAKALFGRDDSGAHFTSAFREPELATLIEATLIEGAGGTEIVERRLAGQTVWLQVQVASLGVEGVLVTVKDISIEQAAGRARSEFVANVSHELRTPLTALSGMIETLRGPARDDPAARDRFLAHMEIEAGRMSRLVADLLSLSRVETEDRSRLGDVDICATIGEACRSLTEAAAARQMTMNVEGCLAPARVTGDRDQLRQVFNNLIENAIKYAASATTVHVTVSDCGFQSVLGRQGYQIRVRDTGEGIAPSHIARLTERFYRVDKHRSREGGGTGLGLAIVKHIVTAHGGRLRIDSKQGVGSTFSVFLPALQQNGQGDN